MNAPVVVGKAVGPASTLDLDGAPQQRGRVLSHARVAPPLATSASDGADLRPLPSPATAVLAALLTIDILLILGHVLFFATSWRDGRLLLNYEPAGYGELFQYAKFAGLAVTFLAIAWQTRSAAWLGWTLLFGFLALDDSLQMHENAALWGRHQFGLFGEGEQAERLIGMRYQDLFELGFVAIVGTALLGCLLLGWRYGGARFRALSWRVAACMALLVFCGVVVDFPHELRFVETRRWLYHALVLVEDGGEMIAATLAVYVALAALSPRNDSVQA